MAELTSRNDHQLGKLEKWFGIQNRLEMALFILLVFLAIFTRFYHLGDRVMSHDESLHTFYSYKLRQGEGFIPNPLMHGPLQFHLIATSFFVFGDSDLTARIPAAMAGVAGILLVFSLRQWLGKAGTWFAAVMMLVSPFMLYYSRYVRNEGLIIPITLLMFLSIFKYYETKESRWLYLFAGTLSLHYAAKETAFIYSAALLLFLGSIFVVRVVVDRWEKGQLKWVFGAGVAAVVGGLVFALGKMFYELYTSPGYFQGGQVLPGRIIYSAPVWIALGVGIFGVVAILAALIAEKGRRLTSEYPAFNLIVLMTTLILPLFAALFQPDAMNYNDPQMIKISIGTVTVLLGLSILAGLIWNWKQWLISAGIFYILFLTLYSVTFTQMTGVVIGLVGSLGYWLQQHDVSRGSQPWYYYLLIQLPIYEYLGLFGSGVAAAIGIRRWLRSEPSADEGGKRQNNTTSFPVVLFLGYWIVSSYLLFTFSGERMPWLAVHIALPLILLAGWGFGQIMARFELQRLDQPRTWFIPVASFILVLACLGLIGRLLGADRPFQGKTLEQLTATNLYLGLLAAAVVAGVLIWRGVRQWPARQVVLLFVITLIALGYLLSARTAGMAAYVNYDDPTEFLVYAHGARGVKDALAQIEEISEATTNGLALEVAYDDDVAWPINWYLRKFTRSYYYGATLSRDQIGYPVILVGDDHYADADALLNENYEVFAYIRMVWPMQEYFNLTSSRIFDALSSPEYRQALWDIWFNRDYSLYGQLIGRDYSAENWSPSDRMRLYVRQDILAKMWEMGVVPVELEEVTYVDPYEGQIITLDPAVVFGEEGNAPEQFQQPRDIAVAPDGTLYIIDSGNNRVQHLTTTGQVIDVWGSFADVNLGDAPGGTFNQPWGIAVAPDGNVFVADTWNHRIQKFGPHGNFITMFGVFDNPTSPQSYWGPRDVYVDADGRLYVVDTGNKRVVIFDQDGQFLAEFGVGGYALGELDEPVGITVADDGTIYLADTWNLRIQVFEEMEDNAYTAVREWGIDGWLGQSLENKPYMDVFDDILCTSDPEGYRILCFNTDGEFLVGWGDGGLSVARYGIMNGVAFDDQGGLWVTDSTYGRIYYFNNIEAQIGLDS